MVSMHLRGFSSSTEYFDDWEILNGVALNQAVSPHSHLFPRFLSFTGVSFILDIRVVKCLAVQLWTQHSVY